MVKSPEAFPGGCKPSVINVKCVGYSLYIRGCLVTALVTHVIVAFVVNVCDFTENHEKNYHENIYSHQVIFTWLSTRLWNPHCYCTGDIAVLC